MSKINNETRTNNKLNVSQEFSEILSIIQRSRVKVFSVVNTLLVDLYWKIGEYISNKVSASEWGRNVVSQLADYLQKSVDHPQGLSDKNLWRMKQFYEEYHKDVILSPLVRELSWTQNLVILSKTKSPSEREFYIRLAIKNKYSKRDLERQISSSLFERKNLKKPKLSALLKEKAPSAEQIFKDSYSLEFLGLPLAHSENELQESIIKNLSRFILEFGKDFSLIGQEYRVQVGHTDFFIDLLLYHRELQCLVVVELKIDEFKPEYLGKMNFYLEVLDRDVKKSHEKPSIGLILCKGKNDEIVEYALSRNLSPLAVAEYFTKLPDKKLLQQKLHEWSELIE